MWIVSSSGSKLRKGGHSRTKIAYLRLSFFAVDMDGHYWVYFIMSGKWEKLSSAP